MKLTSCFVIFSLVGLVNLFVSPTVRASDFAGVWTGTYQCKKQATGSTLTFIDNKTAKFEFFQVDGGRKVPYGAYHMEVWTRGDSVLLVGADWIERPPGFKMVSIRGGFVDANNFKGKVEWKGCDDINYQRVGSPKQVAVTDITPTTTSSTISSLADKLYYSATYRCDAKYYGSYWEVTANPDQTYDIKLNQRDNNYPLQGKVFTLRKASLSDGVLKGIDQRKSFGVAFTFTQADKAPALIWLDGKGNEKANGKGCITTNITVAADPKTYWDEFFTLTQPEQPTINDLEKVQYSYRTLPAVNSLSALDQQSYNQKRTAAWSSLVTAYQSAMPEQLKLLPVETPQQRLETRATIARMANPGFKLALKESAYRLYSNRLFTAGLAVEPLYFSTEEQACERLTVYWTNYSIPGLEQLIGLPIYDWDRPTVEDILEKVRVCGEANPAIQKNAAYVTKSITKNFPAIEKKIAVAADLTVQANTMAAEPRGLKTLLQTGAYQIPVLTRRTQRIDDYAYNRYFVPLVAQAKDEALTNAKSEIDAQFKDASMSTNKLASVYEKCTGALGNVYSNSPKYLQQLKERCRTNAKQVLAASIGGEAEEMKKVSVTAHNALSYINVNYNQMLPALARDLGLQEELTSYDQAHAHLSARAVTQVNVLLTSHYQENTQEFDEKILSICGMNNGSRTLNRDCSRLRKGINIRNKVKACDATHDRLKTSETLRDDVIMFGDAINPQKVSVREFICHMSDKGVDLLFSRKGDMLGKDVQRGRDLFSANLMSVDTKGDAEFWEVETVDILVNNNKLKTIAPSEFIGCIASSWGC